MFSIVVLHKMYCFDSAEYVEYDTLEYSCISSSLSYLYVYQRTDIRVREKSPDHYPITTKFDGFLNATRVQSYVWACSYAIARYTFQALKKGFLNQSTFSQSPIFQLTDFIAHICRARILTFCISDFFFARIESNPA